MELAHGAWSFGVNATEAELETADAVMEELERIGAHSADVLARWMRVHGLRGVKGDTEQCPLAGWLRHSTGDPCSRSAGTTSPAAAAPRSGSFPWTCGGSTTRRPPTPSSSAASTTAPGQN